MSDSTKLAEEFKENSAQIKDEEERVTKTLEEIQPILEKHNTSLQIQQKIVCVPLPTNREERRKK